ARPVSAGHAMPPAEAVAPRTEALTASVFRSRFDDLLVRSQSGDREAVWLFYERFAREARRLVHAALRGSSLRRILGSLDLQQSVFAQFFDLLQQVPSKFRNEQELQKLLWRITHHKVRDQARRHAPARRDVRREKPLDVAALPEPASEPPPEEAS